MERTFFFPLSKSEEKKVDPFLQIDIFEKVDPSFSQFVWPAAPILVKFLISRNHEICNHKNILELGGGAGLPSIAAAMLGCNVFLSDRIDSTEWEELARRNIKENEVESKIRIFPIEWAEFTEEMFELPKFDYIIASDCFYDRNIFEDLICTVSFFLTLNPSCRFWTTYQNRSVGKTLFLDTLFRRWGLECDEIPLHCFDADYFFTSNGSEGNATPANHIEEENFKLWEIYKC
ncbi:Methyltransferase-like protein 23 [Oopsacas minuta]|uniref:Methyltransferase-like protein 23 n=1 Tax=Oopsacas minuta TaxID=111878 RepID=A0AAV7JCT7_9METZ|nr:Methyltransferase-like protein 23 [Oopsacas minuta]